MGTEPQVLEPAARAPAIVHSLTNTVAFSGIWVQSQVTGYGHSAIAVGKITGRGNRGRSALFGDVDAALAPMLKGLGQATRCSSATPVANNR